MATFNLTEKQLEEKHRREQQAKEKLMKRLTPELKQNLEEYEHQDTPEARFVRAVDKILPVGMDIDLESLPFDPEYFEYTTIRQGYLAIGDDGSETRIRDFGNDQRFELTVKSNGTVAREEKNIQIGKEVFESLWPLTLERRIEKTRYYIPYTDPEGDKHTIELDVYHEPSHLDGLCTAEVEFEGRKGEAALRAETFQPPEWFGEDISSNPSYKNKSLASHAPHGPMELGGISM